MTDMTETELRELDAWIAEHVFGDKPDAGKTVPFSSEQYCHPRYSSNNADAMLVLEMCMEKFGAVRMHKIKDGEYLVESLWQTHKGRFVIEDTMPLAICQFAKAIYSK